MITIDASHAEQGGYVCRLYGLSQMLVETGQFDFLRSLNRFVQIPAFGPNRGDFFFDETPRTLEGALIGLLELEWLEVYQRLFDLAVNVLPAVLADQDYGNSTEVDLMQAKAAVTIGALEDAELELV